MTAALAVLAGLVTAVGLAPQATGGVSPGQTLRVSVRSDQAQVTTAASFSPAISGDGRWVVFSSKAELDTGAVADNTPTPQIYVRDMVNNTTRLLTFTYNGDGDATRPEPSAGSSDLRDLFEERLRRPMQGLSLQSLGTGALAALGRDFHFEIDAELIVYGTTEPNARVTLQGEPVQLRPDGTFTVRFSLPDSRQIIPAVAASPDGVEERTIVLAVERNTKHLDPMIHDQMNEM